MEAYQSRVIEEKQELDFKLTKIHAFISSQQFQAVNQAEQERLKRQFQAMSTYSQVLGERIAAFGD